MKNSSKKNIGQIILTLAIATLVLQPVLFSSNQTMISQPQLVSQAPTAPNSLNVTLHGVGATFPAPLIATAPTGSWATVYHQLHPNIQISYQAVGSGKGQASVFNKTSDFGASDAPLSPVQKLLAPNILHIPETIGSVVPAYNLPGIPALNFTGDILAKIYLGQITTWNDAQIQAINAHVVLPSNPITPVHRSDSSGTTFIWTSFLCLDSSTWCSTVGKGTSVVWPVGPGASGNGGVAAFVINTPFAIGYVELNYALNNNMRYGAVQNPAGTFVLADLQTTGYAVSNSTATLPAGNGDWSQVNLLNAAGGNTYPIASFTYFLVYQELNVLPQMDLNETGQAQALIAFLSWVISPTGGQSLARPLSYVPLPLAVVTIDQVSINSITFAKISTPQHKTFSLTINAAGWGATNPGPYLQITSGDLVSLLLLSSDGLSHQWFVDFAGGVGTTGTQSPVFNSATIQTNFTFTAAIWTANGFPSAGLFTYRDGFNGALAGLIRVLPQQTAANLKVANSISNVNAPVRDSTRVTTVGTLLVDNRAQTVTGNVEVVGVDSTSGSITYAKTYTISSLPLSATTTGTLQLRFYLNLAVLPYALSSNVQLQYTVSTSSATASALVHSLTRNVDVAHRGQVDIVDVGIVFLRYGSTVGSANYLAIADLDGNGIIDIIDAGVVAVSYGYPAYY